MSEKRKPFDTFPISKIIPRLFLGFIEAGLGIYLLITFNLYLGLFFSAYWVVSMLVLLPLIRCTKCYYYGKRCNTGWGLLAAMMFPKGESKYFQAGYVLTVILWPLRILPFGLALINVLDGIQLMPDLLFGIYFLTILIHRLYYRASNCPVCHQQSVCPVYNPHTLAVKEPPESVNT